MISNSGGDNQGNRGNLLVFLFYTGLALVFFYPMLAGKLYAQGDSLYYFYPLRTYYGSCLREGFSFWLPYKGLGMDLVATHQSGCFYPFNFLYVLPWSAWIYNFSFVLHYALAAFFTYLYARLLTGMRTAAVFAGLVFGFSGFLMAQKDHLSMVNAAIWLPLLLYLYERVRRDQDVLPCLMASLVVAVQIFAGQFQMCLYTYLVLALFIVYYYFKTERRRRKVFLLLAVLPLAVGLIIALPQILSTLQLFRLAWRESTGYQFFTSYSYQPFMLPQFLYPFLYGGGYGQAYWGEWSLTEMSGFVGVMTLILASLAAFRYRRESMHIRFWGWVAAASFLLMLGGHNPLYRAVYYVPFLKYFRVPARNSFELSFSLAVLAAFGLKMVLKKRSRNQVWIMAGLALSFLAGAGLILFGKGIFGDIYARNLGVAPEARGFFALNNPVIYLPMLAILLYMAWWFWFYRCGKARRAAVAFLILLIVIELFTFGAFHNNGAVAVSSLDSLEYLRENAAGMRVLSILPGPIAINQLPGRIAFLNAYEPMELDDLNNLTDIDLIGLSHNWNNLLLNSLLLSTLNTGYILQEIGAQPLNLEEVKNAETGTQVSPDWVEADEWEGHYTVSGNGEGVVLKGLDEKTPAYIEQQLSLDASTDYLLSFDLVSREKDGSLLSLGIYSELDSQPSEVPYPVSEGEHACWEILRTGPGDTKERTLFFYSFSDKPVLIDNVRLVRLDELPLLPPAQRYFKDGTENQPSVYQKVYEDTRVYIYKNLNCLPRFFLAQRMEQASGMDEVKERFYLRDFDPSLTILAYPEDFMRIGASEFSPGSVTVLSQEEDRIVLEVDLEGEGLLVDSDQFYPGWKAYIDREGADIHRVDGIMRGIVVPAGRSQVELRYEPGNVKLAMFLSLGLFLLVLAACATLAFTGRGRAWRRRGRGARGEGGGDA